METNQQNLQILATKVDMINLQTDEFLEQYIHLVLRFGRELRGENYRDVVFLPYTGRDEETILLLFIKFAEIKYPDYCFDEQNIKVLKYLIKVYLKKSEKPGLIIWGPTGTGKTTLLLLWFEFRRLFLSDKEIDRLNVNEISNSRNDMPFVCHLTPTALVTGFLAHGLSFFHANISKDEIIYIDDIGINPIVNQFGNIVNVLEMLIYNRYDKFKVNPSFEFYATTNYLSEELMPIIKERAFSRLLEMAEWKEGLLNGDDRRKSNNRLNQWPMIENPKRLRIKW